MYLVSIQIMVSYSPTEKHLADICEAVNRQFSGHEPGDSIMYQASATVDYEEEGTEGQDRESYSDTQDRDSYTA